MFFTALVLCILIKLKKAKQYTENLIAKFQNLNQNIHLFWVSLVLFHLCVKKWLIIAIVCILVSLLGLLRV